MAVPSLTPKRKTSAIVLPSTGSALNVSDGAAYTINYPFGMYAEASSPLYDTNFISGASDQVSYTYKKLGGDVLDIELTNSNVYSAYEEAVLEYSYIINIHQGKNIMSNVLGNATGTFDHDGHILSGELSSSLSGTQVNLKYPKFDFTYSKRIARKVSEEVQVGGYDNEYSASFDTVVGIQDYDLQDIIYKESTDSSNSGFPHYNKIKNKRLVVKRVFYKTPHSMWRFYGYYGGLHSVGNLSTYGMYADDSTWEAIPPWQNKMQAMAYEDAIYTRNSHYSYEIKNNKLRIYPEHISSSPTKMWVQFTIPTDAWDPADEFQEREINGINNLNTLPFANIPYKNINSIGKQWIRRFALALTKEMLGQIRGKFSTIPIPGESVTLNSDALLAQAKEEQDKLRDELKAVLDELTYSKLAETESAVIKATNELMQSVPYGIFVG